MDKACSIALGTFDGVHLGHRRLLLKACEKKPEGGYSAALTFHPPPEMFFQGKKRLLMSFPARVAKIRSFGIEKVIWASFDASFAELSAEDFIHSILLSRLKVQHVICGPNFRFGKNAQGDPALLEEVGRREDFTVEVLPPFMVEGELVSSTRIRQAIIRGDLLLCHRLLGRVLEYETLVVQGEKRGRELGFPTANSLLPKDVLLPCSGVYVTESVVDNKVYRSVTSIGSNPTFQGKEQTVETYILDFSGDLYHKPLGLRFLKRIREMVAFPSKDALIKRIRADVDFARKQEAIGFSSLQER